MREPMGVRGVRVGASLLKWTNSLWYDEISAIPANRAERKIIKTVGWQRSLSRREPPSTCLGTVEREDS